jgi:hypothetical protein
MHDACADGLQDDFKRQLAQLHSDVEVAVLHATAPLHKQLKSKADVSQLTSSSSSLEARLSSSEKSLLLGLKSLGDKAALLLQHKADLAALEDWKQQVREELCAVRAQLVAQQVALAAAAAAASMHQGVSQLSSAPVPDNHGSSDAASSSGRGHAQQAAGALEMFTSLMSGQQRSTAAAGDVAGATQVAAEVQATGTADANSSKPVAVLPALGFSSTAATAASGLSSGSGAEIEEAVPLQHGAALDASASPAACPQAAAVATGSSAAGAAASGVAATIVRPLTTSKRHVSPARTQTSGSPKGSMPAAAGKQRPPSMQPWPSSASPAAVELHSAAHNAKLAKAARDRELGRARLGDSRALVAALMQSSAVPAAEDVADALQQQLNVVGLTSPRVAIRTGSGANGEDSSSSGTGAFAHQVDGRVQQQGVDSYGKQAAAAAGGMLSSALAAARATAAAAAAGGTVDGSGRLVGSRTLTADGLQLAAGSPDRDDAAAALKGQQLGGALSASGVTYSLRLQSAGVQQHSSKGASGVARTSSVGALPVCVGSIPGSSSSGDGGSDGVQLLHQSPTAEGLRALLKGNSAHGSLKPSSAGAAASQQLPAADGRFSSGSSTSGSGSKDSGQDAVGAGVGRASPLALMKQSSGQSGSFGGSSSRSKSA